ncbi:hypothetical protein BFW01_g9971 [Lasiodiplodia theobromae]|nr:hypothetical protein BFW01_g9971 [Lasiodiplodia theobromae]
MFLSAILVSFFALMAHAIPLSPQKTADVACTEPGDCYRIQSLNVSLPSGSEEQVQLTFTLWDDAQSANNRTVCSTSWEAGTDGWPQNYVKCDDDMFQWKFSKFDSVTDWGMEAAHDFRFGSFGARSFANGTAAGADFECETTASGARRCSLKENHVINLAYYAMII